MWGQETGLQLLASPGSRKCLSDTCFKKMKMELIINVKTRYVLFLRWKLRQWPRRWRICSKTMNSEWNSMFISWTSGLHASRNWKVQRAQFIVCTWWVYNSWKCHPNLRSPLLFALLFFQFIIVIHQKGCFSLLLFYSGICSHSLLLFEFSVAFRQDFKVLPTVSQTKLTTSSLISLWRKLRLSARHTCLLFVSFFLLSPITMPLCTPREPPFSPDCKIHPFLLQNLSAGPARTGPHSSSPSLYWKCPCTVFQTWASMRTTEGTCFSCSSLGPPHAPGTHDSVYLEITPSISDTDARLYFEKNTASALTTVTLAHSETVFRDYIICFLHCRSFA